jgi:hypothetical protein
MRRTSLPYNYSAEPCGDDEGTHWVRLYSVINPNQLGVTHQHIGKKVIAAQELLEEADRQAPKVEPHKVINRSPHPVGATVIKVCADHIEIVENALVMPSDTETFSVVGLPLAEELEEDESRTASYNARVSGYPEIRGIRPVLDNNDYVTLHLLPHVDNSGITQDHRGVRLDRGGQTYAVHFGLIGDETLVDLPNPSSE